MDGTLLDLNFDNHFWLAHVPRRYAEKHQISLQESEDYLKSRYQKIEGTLNWYCVDHWSEMLDLDIEQLKKEVGHLIAIHPHVIDFLQALKASGKQLALVTNAHQKSLDLKFERTRLGDYLERVITAHDLGLPKEAPAFWGALNQVEPFDRRHTLLVDDSLPVLQSAKTYGIQHLIAVRYPDSQSPEKDVGSFQAILDFRELMPVGGDNSGP
ncbi:MAG TPA: GMP/IMP nucleotidase [Gammaproteobacteria bacterium]|nr:GMP/IMP nucleotidase [Gammaproteobacteria bacterium]